MKIFLSIAVLITFIVVSLSFATVNYPLLGGGIVVSILVFLVLKNVETEKHSESKEMKELLDAVKQQIIHQQEAVENIGNLSKAVTDLSVQLDKNIKEILIANEGSKNDLLAGQQTEGEKTAKALNELKETIAAELSRTSEQITGHIVEASKIADRAVKEQCQLLENKFDTIIEDTKQLVSLENSQYKASEKMLESHGKELAQLIQNEKRFDEGIKSLSQSIEQFEAKYDKGLNQKSELDVRLHEQSLEYQQKGNEMTSNAIKQHEFALRQLVDQLMEITSEMSESKHVVREQILRMQESYVNELKQRVRA